MTDSLLYIYIWQECRPLSFVPHTERAARITTSLHACPSVWHLTVTPVDRRGNRLPVFCPTAISGQQMYLSEICYFGIDVCEALESAGVPLRYKWSETLDRHIRPRSQLSGEQVSITSARTTSVS
jgi:hypothetical protein